MVFEHLPDKVQKYVKDLEFSDWISVENAVMGALKVAITIEDFYDMACEALDLLAKEAREVRQAFEAFKKEDKDGMEE